MRTRLPGNSLLTGKLTGIFAISTLLEAISERKTPVPQPLLGKFPKKHNREFFRTNRELRIDNRDLAFDRWIGVSVHFSHTCFFDGRTRSVLTDNLQVSRRQRPRLHLCSLPWRSPAMTMAQNLPAAPGGVRAP